MSEFFDIVGQFPSPAERMKSALDDPEVIAGFQTGDYETPDQADEYALFLDYICDKHKLLPEEIVEVARRIEYRNLVSTNGQA